MEDFRAELRVAEERFKILLENIPGATAIYRGEEMEIVMANKAMTGFWVKDESVIGKPLLEAVPDLQGQPFIHILKEVYQTGETYSARESPANFTIDGEVKTLYFDFIYRALKDVNGNVEGIIHSATDVTELVLARQRVVDVDKRMRFSLLSACIGTWSFDVVQNLFVLDEQGKNLFGILGEACLPLDHTLKNVHPDDVRQVYDEFLDCLTGRTEHCDVRFRVVEKNNEMRWLHCTGRATFNCDLSVDQFAGIVQDITKETAGMEEQRKLQHQKDHFLSIASHELKTPVTSIKAYAQLLERMLSKDGDKQKADMVARLTGQVARLTTLLDDLLDVSKISNDRLSFKRDYHDFNEIVQENILALNYQTGTHQIKTNLGFIGNIYCDKMRIGQVISNFISNAIKYSPDKDMIVISTAQRGTDVVCCVRDFGIGISEENIDHVFDQFYRVSTAEAYSYQGMGLGLFISAEIIRQEGGKIWVDSEENAGSTFCFSLSLGNNIR